MTQNIYDNPAFFAGYSQLNRSVQGLAGAPEWPALSALLPELADLNVVDLGCGFGWFCRWARSRGAAQVLGIDVSGNMLTKAAAATTDSAIRYVQSDLEQLRLPAASLDLAFSSLALHYIEAIGYVLTTLHRALVPGGRLIFSIEHPIYMASAQPEWLFNRNGHKSWPVDDYLVEGPRTTNWLTDGVIKQHRTMGTTLNLLIQAGFTITHVEEWGPTDDQIADQPALADERLRPMFLLIAAQR